MRRPFVFIDGDGGFDPAQLCTLDRAEPLVLVIETGNPALFEQALALNPIGRMARADEIARGVVFLASPAASFITGTNLVVDGALTRSVQF